MPKHINLDDYCKNVCKCNADSCDKEKCPLWAAPTADVVEVVRCKDCAFYKNESYPYRPNAYMMCACWNDYLPTNPDDFCSYGERKEDEK